MGFAVTVWRDGNEILTIDADCMSGPEPEQQDITAIREAASALLGFIGDLAHKMTQEDWVLVPRILTHEMERAYFSAPMPEFRTGISANQRHKQNRLKMEARWTAMLNSVTEKPN